MYNQRTVRFPLPSVQLDELSLFLLFYSFYASRGSASRNLEPNTSLVFLSLPKVQPQQMGLIFLFIYSWSCPSPKILNRIDTVEASVLNGMKLSEDECRDDIHSLLLMEMGSLSHRCSASKLFRAANSGACFDLCSPNLLLKTFYFKMLEMPRPSPSSQHML